MAFTPIERFEHGRPPTDEADDFARKRRWFHVQALAIVATVAFVVIGIWVEDQRVAAIAGGMLALASIAALKCGRTLTSFGRHWLDVDHREDVWYDGHAVKGAELISVLAMLAIGIVVALFGAIERLDIVASWLS